MWLDRKASYGKIGAVSEANPKTIGDIQDGRSKHITYAMEMPVPHSFYPEISEEGDVREGTDRCTRDNQDTVPIQEGGDHIGGGMCGPCTPVRKHTAEDSNIRIHGIPEREVGAHDRRQTSGTWEKV